MDGIDISRLVGVRALPGLNERFWRRVEVVGDCWIWRGSRDENGYGLFSLPVTSPRGAAQRIESVHRIVYEAVHGPMPPGRVTRHSCDTPPCLRPLHLLPGSKADNARDKMRRGRTPKRVGPLARRAAAPDLTPGTIAGREYNKLKVTAAEVRTLRTLYAEDPSTTAAGLARRFAISNQTAVRIIVGRTRKAAGGPLSTIRPAEGEAMPNHKLTDADVVAMRTAYAQRRETIYQLGARFGITPGTVSEIVRGLTWTHVGGPLRRTRRHHRLAPAEVSAIRAQCAAGAAQNAVAAQYGVSPATVSLLLRGKSHR